MGKIVYLIFLLSLFIHCQSFSRKKFIPPREHIQAQILSEGKARRFLYLPPSDNLNSKKIWIMILHGGGGSPEGMVYLSRASELAIEHNVGIVYPEGYENRWNDGRNVKSSKSDSENIDDVQFLDDVFDHLNSKFGIEKIILAGLSNGGFMTFTYSCETKKPIQSVLSVAAQVSLNRSKSCKNEPLPDYTVILGKRDKVVPYNGGLVSTKNNDGTINDLGQTTSYIDTLDWFAKINQCQSHAEKSISKKSSLFTTIHCKNFPMNLYLLGDMDHVWPGGFFYRSDSDYGFFHEELSATDWIEKKILNKNIGD
jgi:polyhydroxybutyrate depolymerase